MLVDVDHHQGQPVFLLYDFKEGFSALKFMDGFKLGTKAQALVHFLHALFPVAF